MKIGIFGKDYQSDEQDIIRNLFDQMAVLGIDVWIESSFYEYLQQLHFKPSIAGIIQNDEFQLDIALSLGGDGTFLRTAARIGCKEIPILGINTGRLGFLADINPSEIEDTLKELLHKQYRIEERSLLELDADAPLTGLYNYALNEIAVLKRDTSSMITIHASIDGEYLNTYLSDGLLIATPTGSTAYSLSVNGPIIIPQAKNIVLSPVAPHSLNVRPLIVSENSIISLKVETRSDHFLVALDGRTEIFPSGTKFGIKKADFSTNIIKRLHQTFYQTLREKLMWGSDARKMV